MFDPHRIGPERTTSYSRNHGRVIQRKVVRTPSVAYTRGDLEQLVPLMRKNGLVPPPRSDDFGTVADYRIFAGGVDVTDNYTEYTSAELAAGIYINTTTEYLFLVPNWEISGIIGRYLLFSVFSSNIQRTDPVKFTGLPDGVRVYRFTDVQLGVSFEIAATLTGTNGTKVNFALGTKRIAVGLSDTPLNGNTAVFPM